MINSQNARCISVYPEYAYKIASGEKNIEYRSWKTKFRGKLIICTTKTKKEHGYTLCVVDLVDIKKNKLSNNDYKYAWILKNPKPLNKNYVRGFPGLFKFSKAAKPK